MKKLAFLSVLTLIIFSSLAQERSATKSDAILSSTKNKVFSNFSDHSRSRAFCGTDTITNVAPLDSPIIYIVGIGNCSGNGWGYISGTNCYLDIAKADKLNSGAVDTLIGGVFWFGVATDGGNNTIVDFIVWDAKGVNNSPDSVLATKGIPIASIKQDVDSNRLTYVTFDMPIAIGQNTDFFIGVQVSNTLGDTIALMTNTDPQTSPATAWDQYADSSWHAFNSQGNWPLLIANYIWAVMNLKTPVADYSYIGVGSFVSFTNLSTGATSYFWDFGDGNTDISKSPTHTYSTPNTYTVTLISTNSCGSDTITQDIVISGISEMDKLSASLSIYPNPNKGIFNIVIQIPLSGEMSIQLFNMAGKEVYHENIAELPRTLDKQIIISDVTKGIYHLQLSTKEGVVHRKIIIQ